MTPKEVKDAHDEIWEKREKLNLEMVMVVKWPRAKKKWYIRILRKKDFDTKWFNYTYQVRRFLDGLEE